MFSERSLDFLAENRIQNSREWYQAHKEEYRTLVVEPMAELVQALTPTMLDIDPAFDCVPKIGHALSRLYRDTRFSKDKSLYRETAWCLFMRSKKLYRGLPAFFFEISPDRIRYGCGYYAADPATLASLRAHVLRGSKAFREARRAYEAQDVFHIEGPVYKRTRFPDQPPALRDWLDRRDFCLMHEDTAFDWLYSDAVAADVAAAFRAIAPIYHLLMQCEADA